MDTFKGKNNEVLKEFCVKKFCDVVIVLHNFTNKFMPLDISVDKAAKSFSEKIYNTLISNEVSNQLTQNIPVRYKVNCC